MPKKPTKPKVHEPPKALAKTHGAQPRVDAPSAARAAAKALVGAIPVFGRVLSAIGDAEQRTKARRLEQWVSYLQHNDENDETFAVRVIEALQGEDRDQVRSAVLESAKAAHEAIDELVLPSIGRLTRRHLNTGKPSLRTFRELLAILRVMPGDVHAALRAATPTLVRLMDEMHARPIYPGVNIGDGRLHTHLSWKGVYRWIANTPDAAPAEIVLVEGNVAERILLALNGTTPALFRSATEVLRAGFGSEEVEALAAALLD